MNIISNFTNLFSDVWSKGVGGINFSEVFLAVLIFLLFLFLRGFFSKIIIKKLEKFVSLSTNRFDNQLVTSLEGPVKFFPLVIGFFIATNYLQIDGKASYFIENLNRSLITVLIFWSIHQIIEPVSFLIKQVENLLSKDLLSWILKAFKIIIFILGAAAVLDIWGIKIGPVIAGLGLFGVAVALGAQDLFKNLISGILVLVEKRFKVGDWIYVEGIIEGVVERIGFRSTVIRKFDKSLATIPNFQFAEKAVINNTETTNRRIDWIIGLEYKSTAEQLTKCRDQIEKHILSSEDFLVSKDTQLIVKLNQFSASSIDIRVRCFTKTNQYLEWINAKDRLIIAIKAIVEKNGASFAFPSQSVYVEKLEK
ncbi:mechanosensitive ion channel family protein [Pelagibacteraceae bacterium]|jgi:MscS family membrane protein|nr:mechanosensitive ion channel family protein [Pelagibacteraceae bacterium]MDC1538143.1 mechanosensitive ion channel family protein [Pelagibacteraceae bacterium]